VPVLPPPLPLLLLLHMSLHPPPLLHMLPLPLSVDCYPLTAACADC